MYYNTTKMEMHSKFDENTVVPNAYSIDVHICKQYMLKIKFTSNWGKISDSCFINGRFA